MTEKKVKLVGQFRKYTDEKLALVSFLGDVVVIFLGLQVALWARFRSRDLSKLGLDLAGLADNSQILLNDVLIIVFGIGVGLMMFYNNGLYVKQKIILFSGAWAGILRGGVYWAVAYISLCAILRINLNVSRLYVLYSFSLITFGMFLWRFILAATLKSKFSISKIRERLIIIGSGEEAGRLIAQLEVNKSNPYQVIGFIISSNTSVGSNNFGTYKMLGAHENFLEIIRFHSPDIVILADSNVSGNFIMEVSRVCENELIQFKVIPSYFQVLISRLKLETVNDVPMLGCTALPLEKLHNKVLKRIVDIVGSIIGIGISIPIVIIAAIVIKYQSPGSVFYRQVRTGRRGKNFKIIKLRSMVVDAEKSGAQWAKKDDDRRLPIGGFLRAWNFDEVPQFWNVLKGEMSLVGPRPERPELILQFQITIPHYNSRLISKPGITGWAQINGLRGDTDLAERVRYDLYYLENWSLLFDLQIMLQTFLARKNAY